MVTGLDSRADRLHAVKAGANDFISKPVDRTEVRIRICAVADVFDALTSSRPYKKAFSNDEALEIMREERGRHFDPAVLDVFLGNFDAAKEIRERDRNPVTDSPQPSAELLHEALS